MGMNQPARPWSAMQGSYSSLHLRQQCIQFKQAYHPYHLAFKQLQTINHRQSLPGSGSGKEVCRLSTADTKATSSSSSISSKIPVDKHMRSCLTKHSITMPARSNEYLTRGLVQSMCKGYCFPMKRQIRTSVRARCKADWG